MIKEVSNMLTINEAYNRGKYYTYSRGKYYTYTCNGDKYYTYTFYSQKLRVVSCC